MELKEDSEFQVRFTGTNCIKHYLIPVADLDDFNEETKDETEEENPNLIYDDEPIKETVKID